MAPNRIYLDHAATTPVLAEARAAMVGALERWANPSSPHAEGRAARAELESIRGAVKAALGWRHDVILTSGASEAIAIAAQRAKVPGRVVGPTEHDAVGAAMGRARTLAVGEDGVIAMEALDALAGGDPALVALQHVNNETGVIQPVAKVAERLAGTGSLLLVDCAQSVGKMPLPDADLIAISAHKFGGPPGIGALLVRDVAVLRPSGGQERGYRRGTENLPAAAAMAAALRSRSFADAVDRARTLRNGLEQAVVEDGGIVIAARTERSPFIGAYAMPGVASTSQLVQFDLAGIAVSAGSACSSGSMKASRVLEAMGVAADVAGSTIRVSFGPSTSKDEVERFLEQWHEIAAKSRTRAA